MKNYYKYVYLLTGIIIGCFIMANIVGAIIGNTLYLMFNKQHVDRLVPVLADYSQNVDRIKKYEAEKKWERVTITTNDGYVMVGTYIKNSVPTDKAVLVMHGIYQNRSMSIDYVPIYLKLGFNVLLIDLRGHGESKGQMTWGKKEVTDIDAWMAFLKNQKKNNIIGIQGISLGASYALLHSGSNPPIQAAFYVEDSAYDDLSHIYHEKFRSFLQVQKNDFIINMLWFYCQLSMYWHTGGTMAELSPLSAVHKAKSPILFLHGGADELVPTTSMQKLYDACSSYKESHIFADSPHAVSIEKNPREYYDVLRKFLYDSNII
ncbi:alpha/beta hydrolase [Pectinatus sottacetonis]|uniref:alpha/beta hydrolase n=1 Tax=Pectinatus sottacetonis TaxID=1002795 RepID=UPI0018C4CD26|nr:alpha/beta hydrolase [Pectinatus sottacetonis]